MNSFSQPGDRGHSKAFLYFLLYTAFSCGALIMVVEVLGSRVVGPFFGVSLFVWTSLISVTMISLALGYALGGFFSDRHPSADYLFGIITLSGIFVILIPLMKAPVLKLSMEFGLRTGAFVSSLTLFGPSLLLLGCVSPYLIKIVAREVSNIGRTVGSFYALSTIGSVFGTGLTGFFLIAYLSVSHIFFLVGSMLISTAVIYFVFFRGKKAFLAILLVLFCLPFLNDKGAIAKVMDNGTMVRLVDKKSSYYGDIKVVDYSYGESHHRELIIDGLVQGGMDMRNGLPFYPYPYLLTHLPLHINPAGQNALVIGLGAGIIPPMLESQGVITDVVDIDADVVDMARKHFSFKTRGEVLIEDARFFLGQNHKKYDYIILDVFNGDTTPGHVISFEAFLLIRDNLSTGGVLGINLAAKLKGDSYIAASVVRTLNEVFDNVIIYPNFDIDKTSVGNVSIISYNGPLVPINNRLFNDVKVHPFASEVIRNFDSKNLFKFDSGVASTILHDDFNPMDCYDIGMKEDVRRDALEGTDWDILLN